MNNTVVVTGGAGFIGSAVVRALLRDTDMQVLNVDKLTYAGNLHTLAPVMADPRHTFVQADIADAAAMRQLMAEHQPRAILHLAAESHVDRSIDGPAPFIETNISGTFVLLEAALRHYRRTGGDFRFIHVSTDEVFGSLGAHGRFTAESAYDPSSPYAASKAAADHLARAWQRTYGLPVIVTNCSNNYGPYQFPEKLIPLMILKALAGESLPVYGRGENVRDWLFVEDHATALLRVLERGMPGRTYLLSAHEERSNLVVVREICRIVSELRPRAGGCEELITFVEDRPGHDFRYALDASEAQQELAWRPSVTFEQGLRQTVQWYLDNEAWWRGILSGAYKGDRLGVGSQP